MGKKRFRTFHEIATWSIGGPHVSNVHLCRHPFSQPCWSTKLLMEKRLPNLQLICFEVYEQPGKFIPSQVFVFPIFEVFGSSHTISIYPQLMRKTYGVRACWNFIYEVSSTSADWGWVTTSRESRNAENELSRDLCKARYTVRRKQGMSLLGLLRTDFCKRKLFMDRKSIANTSPLCSLPPKHCVIKNLADAKTDRPSQSWVAHYLLQLLLS